MYLKFYIFFCYLRVCQGNLLSKQRPWLHENDSEVGCCIFLSGGVVCRTFEERWAGCFKNMPCLILSCLLPQFVFYFSLLVSTLFGQKRNNTHTHTPASRKKRKCYLVIHTRREKKFVVHAWNVKLKRKKLCQHQYQITRLESSLPRWAQNFVYLPWVPWRRPRVVPYVLIRFAQTNVNHFTLKFP